jgi:hypothetical protein
LHRHTREPSKLRRRVRTIEEAGNMVNPDRVRVLWLPSAGQTDTGVVIGGQMYYFPNPAHKRETTEAGPPRWRPDKEPCPSMTPRERATLLQQSVEKDAGSPSSQRFAVRRGASGLEFYTARVTRVVNGEVEYHGYPTSYVPGSVLRQFREQGLITKPEYRNLVKRLG